jgi:hypothetical protein
LTLRAKVRDHLRSLLAGRLTPTSREWLEGAAAEIEQDAAPERFCALFALAGRRIAKRRLDPSAEELARASALVPGLNLERWQLAEAARVLLLLGHPAVESVRGPDLVEDAFRYADVGELCALYRSLALLSQPERFRWRAGEGARSNMRVVFEATCTDTPYPRRYFDDLAWRQAVIKCIFIEAPLWRFHGLDDRLSDELARMALDLADERRSAGRHVQHELWLCLGSFGGERALESIERELAGSYPLGRRAAVLALARAGELDRIRSLAALETDAALRDTMDAALLGRSDQSAFRALDPSLQEAR